jgi:hypothetical protein
MLPNKSAGIGLGLIILFSLGSAAQWRSSTAGIRRVSVEFRDYVEQAQVNELRERGARGIWRTGSRRLAVSVPQGFHFDGLGVVAARAIVAADKLSPALAESTESGSAFHKLFRINTNLLILHCRECQKYSEFRPSLPDIARQDLVEVATGS